MWAVSETSSERFPHPTAAELPTPHNGRVRRYGVAISDSWACATTLADACVRPRHQFHDFKHQSSADDFGYKSRPTISTQPFSDFGRRPTRATKP
ncbi:hypothetical protein M569_09971 [Genlisea aurea]|uniref:Uncharacterized protein n=1 Tax=Genlisea aurea TaxID=192259 RepID=S8CCW4_9LAMI|nr:hypothetical protein M569_09971 [Genlisea aurea]